jgi:transposase InsO family protein
MRNQPIVWQLQAIGLGSKTFYQEETSIKEGDSLWKQRLENVLSVHPKYGYRPMTAEMKRQGYLVNKKKIQRLMKLFNFAQKPRKNRVFATNSNHSLTRYPNLIKDLIPMFPNHIWVSDITYIKLLKGFCYLAAILDVFTRNVRGWALMTTINAELTIEALGMALSKGIPRYHHSDQGVQYCDKDYVKILKAHQIQISMSDKGQPTQNAFAESFFKTLKNEEVEMFEYETIEDAKKSIKRFIEIVYSQKRLHSSLGYLPPEEFEAKWSEQNNKNNKGRTMLIPIQKTEKIDIFAVS